MSEHQTKRNWQSDLIERYPRLFTVTENGQTYAPGCPSVGDGWRELVETAVGCIADAIAAAPDCLRIVQIKEKYATIRIYWWPGPGFTDAMHVAVEEAVDLAKARSACTCETCGEPGRLRKWLMTTR